jgi:hypothetical protein
MGDTKPVEIKNTFFKKRRYTPLIIVVGLSLLPLVLSISVLLYKPIHSPYLMAYIFVFLVWILPFIIGIVCGVYFLMSLSNPKGLRAYFLSLLVATTLSVVGIYSAPIPWNFALGQIEIPSFIQGISDRLSYLLSAPTQPKLTKEFAVGKWNMDLESINQFDTRPNIKEDGSFDFKSGKYYIILNEDGTALVNTFFETEVGKEHESGLEKAQINDFDGGLPSDKFGGGVEPVNASGTWELSSFGRPTKLTIKTQCGRILSLYWEVQLYQDFEGGLIRYQKERSVK